MEKEPNDIQKRIYNWVIELINFADKLPHDQSFRIIVNQLLRSGTSVGANYIESQAGSSRRDFTNFLLISLKSANESRYWLKLLRDAKKINSDELSNIINEIEEISKMLGASIVTLRNKR